MMQITLIDGTEMKYNTFNEISDYDKIIKLDCSCSNLTSLPDIVSLMTNLKSLNCFNNKLISLPPSIGNLINLNFLFLDNTNITSLPDSISNLSNLKVLYFSHTNITTLPKSIINLRNIKIISDVKNKTPQQQRYYDWIDSEKISDFDEYHEEILIKSALKCS
jgi:Leucine-rich repeat (LRR) protein